MLKRWTIFFVILFGTGFLFSCQNRRVSDVIIIVADDLGYSDLGCFGSEISTPNIDRLANDGIIFTDFHTAQTCSPTRSMLLSGIDNHKAGLGNMAEFVSSTKNQKGKPGYEGTLNNNVVSIASLLQEKGYFTCISGKWHLGLAPPETPNYRGFKKSFTLLNGAANHYFPDTIRRKFWNDTAYCNYPQGSYSTDVYTNKLLEYLNQAKKQKLFMMATYTSPHWPLMAPKEYIDRQAGKYIEGYEVLREKRFSGLKMRGIIGEEAKLPSIPEQKGNLTNISTRPLKHWEALSDSAQQKESKMMELYAAMVENLDYHIGRVISKLKEEGRYNNALIIFMSDNGAAPFESAFIPGENKNDFDSMESHQSYIAYGPQWAHASVSAFRLYKGYATEGGIRTPMIMKLPGNKKNNSKYRNFVTVLDIYPTILEFTNTTYPESFNGNSTIPLRGKSLKEGATIGVPVHEDDYTFGWELFGRYAVRKGNWKAVFVESPFGKDNFELYNLEEDFNELNDLSLMNPEKLKEMYTVWQNYCSENNVILPEWKNKPTH